MNEVVTSLPEYDKLMNPRSKSLCRALLCMVVLAVTAGAGTRKIRGEYRNPALGFAVTIPARMEAVTGDQAGPERGFTLTTPTGGAIQVFGEPNSLEWRTPAEGIRDSLDVRRCGASGYSIRPARIGRLTGAEGRLTCGNRSIRVLLVFRPKGGPIYWLLLETATGRVAEDAATLARLASSFKIIEWK